MEYSTKVKSFLTSNKLKQNDNKTDFLFNGTVGQIRCVLFYKCNSCKVNYTANEKAWNLEIILRMWANMTKCI